MTTFPTTFKNERNKRVAVYDDGAAILELLPFETFAVEAASPLAAYARWSAVTYRADGTVSLTPRAGFVEPYLGRWVLRALNVDGAELEHRRIGKGSVALPKGIPTRVGLDADDDEAVFKEMRIERVEESTPSLEFAGYLVPSSKVDDVWVGRDEGEVSRINAQREELGKGPGPEARAIGDPKTAFGAGPQR